MAPFSGQPFPTLIFGVPQRLPFGGLVRGAGPLIFDDSITFLRSQTSVWGPPAGPILEVPWECPFNNSGSLWLLGVPKMAPVLEANISRKGLQNGTPFWETYFAPLIFFHSKAPHHRSASPPFRPSTRPPGHPATRLPGHPATWPSGRPAAPGRAAVLQGVGLQIACVLDKRQETHRPPNSHAFSKST